MKKNTILKRALTLGLLLFLFTFFQANSSLMNTATVKAATSNDEPNEIKLNVNSKSLVKDTTYKLKVYNLTDKQKVNFKSDSSSIASIDDDGLISTNDYGNASITVTVKEGFKTVKTLKCSITVGPAARNITLTRHDIKLAIDKKKYLKVILNPNNSVEDANFFSSDDSIATVDSNGKVTGVSVGVAYIYASINNKSYDVCKVTVIKDNVDDEE